MKKFLAGILAVAVASGCATGINSQPQVGRISVGADLAARKAYYDRAKVSAIRPDGYVVAGETYSESAIKYYFKAFGSRDAVSKSRSAHGAKVSSALLSIIPPVVGVVVGAYIGLLSSAYTYTYSENKLVQNVGLGAGAGLLIGGLGISLPFGLMQHNKIAPRMQEAADSFNSDLYFKLKLDGDSSLPKPVKADGSASGIDP